MNTSLPGAPIIEEVDEDVPTPKLYQGSTTWVVTAPPISFNDVRALIITEPKGCRSRRSQRLLPWYAQKITNVVRSSSKETRLLWLHHGVPAASDYAALRARVIKKLKVSPPCLHRPLITYAEQDSSDDDVRVVVAVKAADVSGEEIFEWAVLIAVPSVLLTTVWRFLEGNLEDSETGRLIDIYEPVGRTHNLYHLFLIPIDAAPIEPWEEDASGCRVPSFSRLRRTRGLLNPELKITMPKIPLKLVNISKLPRNIPCENVYTTYTSPILTSATVADMVKKLVSNMAENILEDNDLLEDDIQTLNPSETITLLREAIPQIPFVDWEYDEFLEAELRSTAFARGVGDISRKPKTIMFKGAKLSFVITDSTSPMLGQDDYDRMQDMFYDEHEEFATGADLAIVREKAKESTASYTTKLLQTFGMKWLSYKAECDTFSERDCDECQELEFFDADSEGNDPFPSSKGSDTDGSDGDSLEAKAMKEVEQGFKDVEKKCTRHAKKHFQAIEANVLYCRFPHNKVESYLYYGNLEYKAAQEGPQEINPEHGNMLQKIVDRIYRWNTDTEEASDGYSPSSEHDPGLNDFDLMRYELFCSEKGKRCKCFSDIEELNASSSDSESPITSDEEEDAAAGGSPATTPERNNSRIDPVEHHHCYDKGVKGSGKARASKPPCRGIVRV
jgi:hypothetical protein